MPGNPDITEYHSCPSCLRQRIMFFFSLALALSLRKVDVPFMRFPCYRVSRDTL